MHPPVTYVTLNGHPYPSVDGLALCWVPDLYCTPSEAPAYRKMRTVLRAMLHTRPDALATTQRDMRNASSDRIFGHTARQILAIMDEEIAVWTHENQANTP